MWYSFPTWRKATGERQSAGSLWRCAPKFKGRQAQTWAAVQWPLEVPAARFNSSQVTVPVTTGPLSGLREKDLGDLSG